MITYNLNKWKIRSTRIGENVRHRFFAGPLEVNVPILEGLPKALYDQAMENELVLRGESNKDYRVIRSEVVLDGN